jgi:hypothetical protein
MLSAAGAFRYDLDGRRRADDINAEAACRGLEPLKAIYHQTGNLVVKITEEEATAFGYGDRDAFPSESNWSENPDLCRQQRCPFD